MLFSAQFQMKLQIQRNPVELERKKKGTHVMQSGALALVLKRILVTLPLTTCKWSWFSINNGMKYIETQTRGITWPWFNYFVHRTVVAITGFLGKVGVLHVAAKIWDAREGKALKQYTNGYFISSCFPFEEQRKKIKDSELKIHLVIAERKLGFAWGF